jgi:hypothetical protein
VVKDSWISAGKAHVFISRPFEKEQEQPKNSHLCDHISVMKKFFQKPVNAFFFFAVIISVILFTVPINMFDGEVIFSHNGQELTAPMKMSLSYFIGLWIDEEDMKDVVAFHLVGKGYLLVFLMIVGLPALLAYRVWIGKKAVAENNKQP